MIRRPPRSTLDRLSAASDVYKRQTRTRADGGVINADDYRPDGLEREFGLEAGGLYKPVSYTHLRAHETVLDIVCRLLLEKKNKTQHNTTQHKQLSNEIKRNRDKENIQLIHIHITHNRTNNK